MKKQTVVYIVGDERVYFPSLVAFSSLEQHNPGRFDLKLITYSDKLRRDQHDALHSVGVDLVNITDLPASIIDNTPPMWTSSGQATRWPTEMLINWAMPEYFAADYEQAIKLDYDVLCIAPIDELVNALIDGVAFAAKPTRTLPHRISDEHAADFAQATGYTIPDDLAIQSGIVAFNTQLTSTLNFFKQYTTIYNALFQRDPNIFLLDQVALAILFQNHREHFSAQHERINAYSTRTPGACLIHYWSRSKPWNMTPSVMLKRVRRGKIPRILCSQLWLNHAKDLPGFDAFSEARPWLSDRMARRLLTLLPYG